MKNLGIIYIVALMFCSICSYSQNFVTAENFIGKELNLNLQEEIADYSLRIDSLLNETSSFTIFDASMYNHSMDMGEEFVQSAWNGLLEKHTTTSENYLFINRVYNKDNELSLMVKFKIKREDPLCSDTDTYNIVESNEVLINSGVQNLVELMTAQGFSEDEKIRTIVQYTFQKAQYICCEPESSADRGELAESRSVTSCNPDEVDVLVALQRRNLYFFILGEIRSQYLSSEMSSCFDETSLPEIDYSFLPLSTQTEERSNYTLMPMIGYVNITPNGNSQTLSCPLFYDIVENVKWYDGISNSGNPFTVSMNVRVLNFGIFTVRIPEDHYLNSEPDLLECLNKISEQIEQDLFEYQYVYDKLVVKNKWDNEWVALKYLSSRDINYYENPIKYRFLVGAITSAPEIARLGEWGQSVVVIPPSDASQFIYNLLIHIGTGDNYNWILDMFHIDPHNLEALLSFEYEDGIDLEIFKIITQKYNEKYFKIDNGNIQVNGVNVWDVPNLSISLDKDLLGFYKDKYKFQWRNQSFGGIDFDVITSANSDTTFNAFDPIAISEIDIENFTVFDVGFFPACVLPYITKFAEEENEFRALMVAAEVAALAMGGGVLYRGLMVGSYFYIASGTIEISANLLRNLITNNYDYIEDDSLRLKVRKYLTIIEFVAGMSTAINFNEAQRVTFTLKLQEAQNAIRISANANELHQVNKLLSIAELSMKMPQGKLLTWINGLDQTNPQILDYLANLGNLSEDVLKNVSLIGNNNSYLLFCKGISDPNVGFNLRVFFNGNPNGVKAWKEALEGGLVHMRTKTEFLETVGDYLKATNPTPRIHPNMSLIEEASIRFYTTNPGYKDLNRALRGDIPMTPYFQEQADILTNAVSKLPVSSHNAPDNNLWRIENLTDSQFASEYVQGVNVTKPSFFSSTYSEAAIVDATRNRPHNVLVRIEGKNGKLVEDVSTLPSEKEILFNKNTEFEVVEVGFSPHPDFDAFPGTPIKTVWLKEK